MAAATARQRQLTNPEIEFGIADAKELNYDGGAFLLENGKLVDSTKRTLRDRLWRKRSYRGRPQRLRHR